MQYAGGLFNISLNLKNVLISSVNLGLSRHCHEDNRILETKIVATIVIIVATIKKVVNSNGRYRYNDLVRPENQLLLNGTKMDWKSLVISDFVIPDLQNGQKWPKCPQNGFMIFVPSKLAKHVWPSCSVYKMQKKLL